MMLRVPLHIRRLSLLAAAVSVCVAIAPASAGAVIKKTGWVKDVTITEYGDLQCPVCARFATEVIPDLIADEVRTGRARLEFRNWVIIGPESADAAAASLAAGEQGRMWSFVELFYG